MESASAQFLERDTDDLETRKDQEHIDFYAEKLIQLGYPAKGILGFTHRAREIVRITKENDVDMLVIGAHGHAGIKDWFYGQTIDSVRHGQSYDYLDQIEHSKNDQHPMAFILACMDSRVPPEIIFDQGIGELFVDRVAGNVEDQYILGSMEYAVNVKGVKLIVVLGHRNCGAIHAAFEHIDPANEDLVPLVDHIKEDIIPNDPSPYDASAKHHVMKTIEKILNKSKAIRSRVEAHEVMIVGGLYDVTNGTIDWNTANW